MQRPAMPVPKPMKLEFMKEAALPSPSAVQKYTVSPPGRAGPGLFFGASFPGSTRAACKPTCHLNLGKNVCTSIKQCAYFRQSGDEEVDLTPLPTTSSASFSHLLLHTRLQ